MARRPAAPKVTQAAHPASAEAAAALTAVAASASADPVQVRLTSSRAPYTRGGVRFASNRVPVSLGRDQITEDQLLKIDADAAITIELVLVETGRAVTVPHGTLTAAHGGDEAALKVFAELQDALAAPASEEGKA